jgi:hypothetical protein
MTPQPILTPPRAAQLRVLALALMLIAGLVAAAVIALWEPVADFLGEGGIRVFDVDGGARRGLIVGILAGATLIGGHALWNWRGFPRYVVAALAGLAALVAAGPLALLAITFGLALLAIEVLARLERSQLGEVGPRVYPVRWATGTVLVAAFLAVAAYISWFLISPLLDEGTELDEALAFALATPAASSTPATATTPEPTTTPEAGDATASTAEPTAMAAEPPVAMLVSSGELMGADSFHFGSGDVLLIRDPDGNGVLRFEDYEVRNGPDIHVYITPDAAGDVHVDGAIDLGSVRATRGNVNYELPAGTDLDSLRAVVIYCVPFQVVFASAELGGA